MRLFVNISALAAFLAKYSSGALGNYYGAMAFSNSFGAWGTAYNYWSRACSVVAWFQNACGALATAPDNACGTGWAGDLGVA
jgi:hypothetical protein